MFYSKFKKTITVCFSIMLMLFCTSCGKQVTILTNVEEGSANQILVLLESKGILSEKILVKTTGAGAQSNENMWNIAVDSTRATEALAILNRIGLPRKPSVNLLDLFPQQGMMTTDKEEEVRYNEGLNQQLASTICKIDGVLDAEVQISFPEEDTFNPDAKKEFPRASVFIKHDGVFDDPNTLLPQKIRRYISGSIIDMRYDDVTVVTARARFTDINLRSLEPKTDATPWGTQDFVRIWSIVVSQDSASSFRTILFLFCFFMLVFIAALAWMAWKVQDVFKQMKNVKSFFSPEPLKLKIQSESDNEQNEPPQEGEE